MGDSYRFNVVLQAFKANGMIELTEETSHPTRSPSEHTSTLYRTPRQKAEADQCWNIRWGGGLTSDDYQNLLWFQKVNHFPGDMFCLFKLKLKPLTSSIPFSFVILQDRPG